MNLISSTFEPFGEIPRRHTCQGEDVSPPLIVTGVPPKAKSLALICDDPDAPQGTWVHWLLYDLPPSTNAIPENIPPVETVLGGAKQGINDFGKLGWGGPCPPHGYHRYYFKGYALDTVLNLPPKLGKEEVLKAMQGHVIDQAELIGRYRKVEGL